MNSLRANTRTFAAAGAASGEVHRVDELEEHLLRGAVFLREPMRFAAVRHAVVAAHAHGAGVAAGVFCDHKDAVAHCVRVTGMTLPDPEGQAFYQRGFQIYRDIQRALAPVYHEM